MDITFGRPTIYASHSMRGDGSKTVQENCEIASRIGDKIERIFPEIDLYVPGRHDLSLQVLWRDGVIGVQEIMHADLTILRACHGWVWFKSTESEGCELEYEEAVQQGLTSGTMGIITTDLLKSSYPETRRLMGGIVKNAIKRFKAGANSTVQQ